MLHLICNLLFDFCCYRVPLTLLILIGGHQFYRVHSKLFEIGNFFGKSFKSPLFCYFRRRMLCKASNIKTIHNTFLIRNMQWCCPLPVKHTIIKSSSQKKTLKLAGTPFFIANNSFCIRVYKDMISNKKIILTVTSRNSFHKNTTNISNSMLLVK